MQTILRPLVTDISSRFFCVLIVLSCLVSESRADESQATTADQEIKWTSLFNGRDLDGWEVLKKDEFADAGKVHVKDGNLVLEKGQSATGARWTKKFPTSGYEIAFDAKRVAGGDFFCGLTFPVEDGSLTLILGGWSGWVVGLSCIDDQYAIDNETCGAVEFQNDQWYRFRVRVEKPAVRVWVDDEEIITFETEEHKLAVSSEMKPCRPVGLATWETTGAIRKIRYRGL